MIVAYVMVTRVCRARHVHMRTITLTRLEHSTISPDELTKMTHRADQLSRLGAFWGVA
jgi:hypothetical protein